MFQSTIYIAIVYYHLPMNPAFDKQKVHLIKIIFVVQIPISYKVQVKEKLISFLFKLIFPLTKHLFIHRYIFSSESDSTITNICLPVCQSPNPPKHFSYFILHPLSISRLLSLFNFYNV